ncbi:MAG: helix-turn-helix domain-containing protein [Culicoidibacterales bacterium]
MDYIQLRSFLRGELGLNNRQIARDTGYSENHISSILHGRDKLSQRFIDKITKTYQSLK